MFFPAKSEGLSPSEPTTFAWRTAFHFFGLSFLILILILLLICEEEEEEIKIRIKSKIKRGTQKCEMHPPDRFQQIRS